MSVRPADFPPPFDPSEFVAEPTDPPDERIDVGALIVGAGPGGLAAAIRLGQLLEDGRARASASATSRSRSSRRARARRAPPLRRGRQPACLPPALPGDAHRGHALHRAGRARGRLLPDREACDPHPGAADDVEPRELRRVDREVARWLAERAEELGVDDRPRDRSDASCSSPAAASSASAPATGAGDGRRGAPELRARLRHHRAGDDPRRGHAGSPHRRRARASSAPGPSPQVWALGVKEVWEVARPLDRVIHTMGWPLRGREQVPRVRRQLHLPARRGHGRARDGRRARLRRRHAVGARPPPGAEGAPVRPRILEGGKRVAWGAKTIPEGGFLALPDRFHFPGGMIVGDGPAS